jgi:hypothetical protein
MMKAGEKNYGRENGEVNRDAAKRPALRGGFGATFGGSGETGTQRFREPVGNMR